MAITTSELAILTKAFQDAMRLTLLPALKELGGTGGGGYGSATRSRTGPNKLEKSEDELANIDTKVAESFKTLSDRLDTLVKKTLPAAGKDVDQIEKTLNEITATQRDLFKELGENSFEKFGKSKREIMGNVLKAIENNTKFSAAEITKIRAGGTKEVETLLEAAAENTKLFTEARKKNKEAMKTLKDQLKAGAGSSSITGVVPGVAEAGVNAGGSVDKMMVNTIMVSSMIVASSKTDKRAVRKAIGGAGPKLGINADEILSGIEKLTGIEYQAKDTAKLDKAKQDIPGLIKKINAMRGGGVTDADPRLKEAVGKLAEQMNILDGQMASATATERRRAGVISDSTMKTGIFSKVLQGASNMSGKFTPALEKMNTGFVKSGNFLSDQMGMYGHSLATASGALAFLVAGVKQLWGEFRDIAKVGLGGKFIEISRQAAAIGLSTAEYGQVIQENRNVLTGMGGDINKFSTMLQTSGKELRNFGLVGRDAAEATMSMAQAGAAFGVSVNNQDALNDSIAKQTKLFSKMSAVTGVSIKDLAKQAATMAESADMQESLARLSVEERQGRMMDLMQQKQILIQQGLSADKAQKILEAQEKALKSSVKERYDAAVKIQQMAGVVGMGAEGGEAAKILMKGSRASADEKARLQEIMKGIRSAGDGMMEGNLATEHLMNELNAQMGGIGTELLQGGREQAMAVQNAISDSRADSMLKETTSISKNTANALETMNTLEKAFTNGWTKVALGITALGVLLSKSLIGKLAGGAKGLLGGGIEAAKAGGTKALAKFGGKALLKGALATTGAGLILAGAVDAIEGFQKAEEIFGKNATLGQRLASTVGGFLSGMIFGVVSTEDMATGLYDVVGKAKEWVAGIPKMLGDMASAFGDYIQSSITSFVDGLFSKLKNVGVAIMDFFGVSDKTKEAAISMVDGVQAGIKTWIDGLFDSMKKMIGMVGDWIAGKFKFAADTLGISSLFPGTTTNATVTAPSVTTPATTAVNARTTTAAPATAATNNVPGAKTTVAQTVTGQTINTPTTTNIAGDPAEIIRKLSELIEVNRQELELARAYYASSRGNTAPGVNATRTIQAGVASA